MKILITTDGTWGDVLPFIFTAKELKNRGHEVIFLTNEYYKDFIEQKGLTFIKTTDTSDRAKLLNDPMLWDGIKGVKVIGKAAGIIFEKSYPIIFKEAQNADLIISYSFMYAAKTVAEILNKYYMCLFISPIQMRSHIRLPVIDTRSNPNTLPNFIKKLFYFIGDNFFIDPYFSKNINVSRRSLGLRPIKRFSNWAESKELNIGFWSDWYAKVESDQKNLELVGFPTNIEFVDVLDEKVSKWLKDGKPPILFTLGSGYVHESVLFKNVLELARSKKERVLYVGKINTSIPEQEWFMKVEKVSLSKTLPFCSLIIHHGGAGTVTQSLISGIPQLIAPMSHDQPDNACRVFENGLGNIVKNHNISYLDLENLVNITRNEKIIINCKIAANRINLENNAIKLAVDKIEASFEKHC